MKSSTVVQRPASAPLLHLVTADEMLNHMKGSFDRVAHRAFEIFQSNGDQPGRALDDWLQAESEIFHPTLVDVSEAEGILTVKAEVPGFSEKDIEVNVEPLRVTISGKRESFEEKKEGRTVYSERCADEIYRSVELPLEVDTASKGITATCDRGILTIALPKAGKAKARSVKVEAKPAAG